MFHFRKPPIAAKAKAAPASPRSQIPRFLINSNCGGSSCMALARDWLREEPLSRALGGRLHKNEISAKAPSQTGHFWVTGALAWIFSSSACSQQDEVQSFAPFLCFLCGVWKNETFPGAGAQKAPAWMDGWWWWSAIRGFHTTVRASPTPAAPKADFPGKV